MNRCPCSLWTDREALSGSLAARVGHFSLDACNAGATALDLAKYQKYDTIIVDVDMPGMNRFEVLRLIFREAIKRTQVLSLTR